VARHPSATAAGADDHGVEGVPGRERVARRGGDGVVEHRPRPGDELLERGVDARGDGDGDDGPDGVPPPPVPPQDDRGHADDEPHDPGMEDDAADRSASSRAGRSTT
jgi:hypothetical protein